MATAEKADLTAFNVVEGNRSLDNESPALSEQTRVKRLFTESQLFAFSTAYLGTWVGVGSSMYYAFLNGGPVAFLFNYIIIVIGVMAQAASLAELASIQPMAGGQYYWTYRLAPPQWKRFLTWCQGWTTWIGFVAGLAGVLNSEVLGLEATINLNYPSYETTGWKTFLIIAALIVFCAVMNIWFFWLIPWFELGAGILNVAFFFVQIALFWVMAPRNPASFLLERSVFSGWDNYFVSWNIGVLSQAWLFTGFECIVHMSEDSKNPKVAVPRSMFNSIWFNGLVGLVMLFTVTICMPPDIGEIIVSASPMVTITMYATGSLTITTVTSAVRLVMGVSCAMAAFSSTSRLTWAWARDGGLPQYFGYVDESNRVPARGVVLKSVLIGLLAMLNIGSGSYVALGAITSLCVIGFYVSYIIMLFVTLYARSTKEGLVLGEWNLGRYGTAINVFALVFSCWFAIFLGFPSLLPVTPSNMNWSLPAYVTIMILTTTLWIFRSHKTWPGPNEKIMAFVLQSST